MKRDSGNAELALAHGLISATSLGKRDRGVKKEEMATPMGATKIQSAVMMRRRVGAMDARDHLPFCS